MAWTLADLEETLLIGSTLVEGSTLSEGQARQVLAGKTVQGHAIGEIRELLNYRAAVEWLLRELTASPFVSVDLLLNFHRLLFFGLGRPQGQWKTHDNFTFRSDGSKFSYAPPKQVPAEMDAWLERFHSSLPASKARKQTAAPMAAKLYYDFQTIHPFEDGNGRIGRILAAYWLHWRAGLQFHFVLRDKVDHLQALESANTGDLSLLVEFFKKRIKPPQKRKP